MVRGLQLLKWTTDKGHHAAWSKLLMYSLGALMGTLHTSFKISFSGVVIMAHTPEHIAAAKKLSIGLASSRPFGPPPASLACRMAHFAAQLLAMTSSSRTGFSLALLGALSLASSTSIVHTSGSVVYR